MRKRITLREMKEYYDRSDNDKYHFKLTDFANSYITDFTKSHMITTLSTKAEVYNRRRIFYAGYAKRYTSLCKIKTLSSFKGYKNGKSMYNRLKLPRTRTRYDLRGFIQG